MYKAQFTHKSSQAGFLMQHVTNLNLLHMKSFAVMKYSIVWISIEMTAKKSLHSDALQKMLF